MASRELRTMVMVVRVVLALDELDVVLERRRELELANDVDATAGEELDARIPLLLPGTSIAVLILLLQFEPCIPAASPAADIHCRGFSS